MFSVGDRVSYEGVVHYTGVVVGFLPKDNSYIRIKRDDGKTGRFGDFWQVPITEKLKLDIFTLENE